MKDTLEQRGTHSSEGASHEKALEAGDILERERTSGDRISNDVPVKRKGGFKRHCARFWWVHVIIFCIIFLIVALCLVYVGMPKIAQHQVNDTHLELTELKFLEPTSNSIRIQQKAILHNPSRFTPTLDAFTTDLYYVSNETGYPAKGSVPMVKLLLPEIHALHPTSEAVVAPQVAAIENMDETKAYTTAVLEEEYVTTSLVGRTPLHLGALPTVNVNYNTSVVYKGLNGLKGFDVTDMKLNLTAGAGNPNLAGNAFIPNPSVITIELGNVTLILSTAKAGVIGNATINDMLVVPGDNHFPMQAVVDQALVLQSMEEGMVDLQIIGNSSVYNGQHLPYFEAALASTHLNLKINATKLINDALSH